MYRKCAKFNLICHIAQFVRRATWKRISRPISVITFNSHKAIIKHFGTHY